MFELMLAPINIATWLACYLLFSVFLGLGFLVKDNIEAEAIRPAIGFFCVCVAYYLPLFAPGLISFDALLWMLTALGVIGWIRAIFSSRFAVTSWLLLIVLSMPISLMFSARTDFGWDGYTNWLPAAKYLFLHHGFPTREIPGFTFHNDYPYGLPLQHALVDLFIGSFSENVTTIMNAIWPWTLLMWFVGKDESFISRAQKFFLSSSVIYLWQMCLGEKLPGAAIAEPILGILVAHAGLYLAHCYFVSSTGPKVLSIWRFSLAVALLASLSFMKETGLLYAIAIFISFVVVHYFSVNRRPEIDWSALVQLGLLLAILIGQRAIWNTYMVYANIPKGFSIRPLSDWNWVGFFNIFVATVEQINHRPFWVIFIVLILGLSLRRFLKNGSALFHPAYTSEGWNIILFSRALSLAAIVFAGIIFLLYLSSFSDYEARNASSFPRYMAPMGTLLAVGLFIYLPHKYDDLYKKLRSIFIFIGPLIYISFAVCIVALWRVGFVQAPTIQEKLRSTADAVSNVIPAGARVEVVDEIGGCLTGGYLQYFFAGRYWLAGIVCNFGDRKGPDDLVHDAERGDYSVVVFVSGDARWTSFAPPARQQISIFRFIDGKYVQVALVD